MLECGAFHTVARVRPFIDLFDASPPTQEWFAPPSGGAIAGRRKADRES
jgi:hypothetical protein